MLPDLVNLSMMRVCRASPTHHNAPRSQTNPVTTPPNRTTPTYTRARARPISRARTLPTNRHEGGSLT